MGQRMIRCGCCRCYTRANPRIRDQRYCGRKKCQQARKNKWLREKMRTDADYRATQKESQRAWLYKKPDYWKQYRRKTPLYTKRNRYLQKERDRKRGRGAGRVPWDDLAKKDALDPICDANSKRYYLLPVAENLAKKDALMVKIIPISMG